MFVPIADINPLEHVRQPYVTYALMLANVLVFAVLQRGVSGTPVEASMLSFGAIPAVVSGAAVLPEGYFAPPPDLTLLTYMFLHGGWLHLLGNTAFLWVFADNVEDAMGHLRFLAFYLLCGVAAGLVHVLVQPESEAPLVGASGAVAGIIAAYLVLHPNVRLWALVFMKLPLKVPVYLVVALWLAVQMWQALSPGDPDTAWWAHLGGFAAGAALVTVMRRRGVALLDTDPSGVPSAPGERER
ncbi:rhomboid family intramembrane serine protease [Xanthobacter sediminis]